MFFFVFFETPRLRSQILEFAAQEILEFILEFAVQEILEFRWFAKKVGF